MVHGVVGVTVGAAVFVWPDITERALLYVTGRWAIVKGLVEIVARGAAAGGR